MCRKSISMIGFKKAYDNIKRIDAQDVRQAIMESCKWNSREYFYMKKNGQTPITPSEAVKIKAVFANVGIDATTGSFI